MDFHSKKVLESWDWELSNHTIKSYVCRSMLKMSKIDQIHLRAVMLCMSKMSKMGKEHTHTFWLITSLILNGFSIRKSFGKLRLRAFQPYHQILCMLKHVKDVEDRSNTPKGCNAMYVEDIKTSHNRCLLKYVEDVEDRSNTHKGCNAMYVEDVEDIKTSHNRCLLKYVEDVKDRSNTHKGCNAMYVKDVEDIKTSHNLRRLRHT